MRRSKVPQSFTKHCWTLAILWACVVSNAFAQQPQSFGLRVLVTDEQQHAVAGAVCSLSPANNNAKVAATASTDERGIAKFPATLIPGNYKLRVESPGFETFHRNDFVVKDGETTEIAVSLKVAAVTGNVTIALLPDEATNVQAGSSTAAGTLQRQSLQRLPLAAARIDEALPL